jgi:putative ABC transport system substrate-binding protein
MEVPTTCSRTDPFALAVLAARHAIPAIYPYREFAAAGGLMGYGPDLAETYRVVGTYAGRILKDAQPTGSRKWS